MDVSKLNQPAAAPLPKPKPKTIGEDPEALKEYGAIKATPTSPSTNSPSAFS